MQSPRPQALLFDLGGVLVEIDFSRAFRAWSVHSSLSTEELTKTFQFDEQYERHERGEISADEYFDHVASTLKLSATHEQVESGWNSIFVGEISTTRRLVESARRSMPCYAFSNTNASHMAHWSNLFPDVVGAFDRKLASHEIGMRKPERRAFGHICHATGLPASSFTFFDDLPENVDAAIDAGLKGVLVRTPHDVASALCNLGHDCRA